VSTGVKEEEIGVGSYYDVANDVGEADYIRGGGGKDVAEGEADVTGLELDSRGGSGGRWDLYQAVVTESLMKIFSHVAVIRLSS